MTVKGWCKQIGRGIAFILVTPSVISYRLRASVLGRDRALFGSSQAWALVPGLTGQYLRRAFLSRALAFFHPSATVEFGTIFSRAQARVGRNVYIGPMCHLGLVDIGADVLIASAVHVPSGQRTHGIEASDVPIRDQPGELKQVQIGEGSWIGSAAVVMADVGADCVVASGAVVTERIPDRVIAGGVPARVLSTRDRDEEIE